MGKAKRTTVYRACWTLRKELDHGYSAGGTFTPKQLKLDRKNGKLYWSDREGMRVMRSNLDGSRIETLIETGQGDHARLDAGTGA